MTMAGRTLDDLGGTLSDRALLAFARRADGQLAREVRGEDAAEAAWRQGGLVAELLATAVDSIAMQTWLIARCHAGRGMRAPMPRPLPRPGVRGGERRYGRGAVRAADFAAWWERGDSEGVG